MVDRRRDHPTRFRLVRQLGEDSSDQGAVQSMKAIIIDEYGGSDRLRLEERPDPRPAAGEILVRVRAAGVNPADWKIRSGDLRMIPPGHAGLLGGVSRPDPPGVPDR